MERRICYNVLYLEPIFKAFIALPFLGRCVLVSMKTVQISMQTNRVAYILSDTILLNNQMLPQEGKYMNFLLKLREQTKPNTMYLPHDSFIDFIFSVNVTKILLPSVGQAICEPINFDR